MCSAVTALPTVTSTIGRHRLKAIYQYVITYGALIMIYGANKCKQLPFNWMNHKLYSSF